MRITILLPLILACSFAHAQGPMPGSIKDRVTLVKTDTQHAAFVRHSVIATIAVGFADYYRSSYAFPKGFDKNNFTGFAPVYGKVEYGISKHVGLAAILSYDVVYANYYQLFYANGNTYTRYKTDKVTIAGGGVAAYYHFMPVKKLDAFVGVGLSLVNVHHTMLAQGDSTVLYTDRNVAPMLKAGARYYFVDKGSVFADLGFDKQSVFSIGFSARLFRK